MLAVMRTSTVAVLTAVHNFHLNSVTLLSIRSQLIGSVANTDVRAQSVMAAVSTVGLFCLTLINIFTSFPISSKGVANFTVTVGLATISSTLVHTASVLIGAGIL